MSSRSPLALIVSLCALLALAAPATAATTTSSKTHKRALARGTQYLALGDSVTFGYEEPNVVPPPNYKDAQSFIGYPEDIAKETKTKVINASCPGETSASLIDASAQSNGCENSLHSSAGYRTAYPLHVKYAGSQLAFALKYLRKHHKVRLVSLMIGANDVFVCQTTSKDGCLSPSEQQAVFAQIAKNVHLILGRIRKAAHYKGTILIVNYYSLNYASALFSNVSLGINKAMDTAAAPFHVKIADSYGEWQQAVRIFGGDDCKAGLLTRLSTGSCGVHPTYAGQALLAQGVLKAIRP